MAQGCPPCGGVDCKRRDNEKDDPSVMERIAQLKQYLVDVRTEARKVVWPTRKDTVQTTIVVFGMVIIVSLFLWIVDALLAQVVKLVIG